MTPDPRLADWDRTHVWHAFTQMADYEPLLIERGAGCRLFDVDGRAYLDATASLWCNVHGHAHPRLDEALRAQLAKVAHVTNLGASNPTTVRLARRLVELAPAGLSHVFFSSDGSSAVEVALKLAFQFWRQTAPAEPNRSSYLAYGDAYHGDTLGSASVGGVGRFHDLFAPLLFPVERLPAPVGELAPHVERLERCLAERRDSLAAVVIEPLMQCAAGMLAHPPGYLRAVRELTRRYDVLLIADEVAVGCGRTGRMFACEHEGVEPDLLCLGKGLTGGYLPLAATLASERVWNAFLGPAASNRQFFHGHTYSGNPLAAAVALESLVLFDEEQTLARLAPKIARMAEHLSRWETHPRVGRVAQRGLLAGIELVERRTPRVPFAGERRIGAQVCRAARERGVLARPLGDVLVVVPPLSIGLDELDAIFAALEHGVATVLGSS